MRKGLFVLILVFIFCSCQKKEPVKIGYVGGLTGRTADLGIAGRDGTVLAVEECNSAGGINGRQIELIVKDDQQNVDSAKKVVQELINEKVAAIVGHMTSSMTMATIDIINKNKIFNLSPTSSTNKLTGIDDYFFRVYPYIAQATTMLAQYVYKEKNIRTVCVVYETANKEYTMSAFESFRKEFESLGGKIIHEEPFKTGPDVAFMEIAEKVKESNADCLYILANAMDTAMLCQQLAKLECNIFKISGDWGGTDEVIEYGGKTVEGITYMHSIDRNSQTPAFLAFEEKFMKRFGHKPSFAASHAYDSVTIIAKALRENDNPAELKNTILKIRKFDCLQTQIQFDNFGDVIRKNFPVVIRNGEFINEESE